MCCCKDSFLWLRNIAVNPINVHSSWTRFKKSVFVAWPSACPPVLSQSRALTHLIDPSPTIDRSPIDIGPLFEVEPATSRWRTCASTDRSRETNIDTAAGVRSTDRIGSTLRVVSAGRQTSAGGIEHAEASAFGGGSAEAFSARATVGIGSADGAIACWRGTGSVVADAARADVATLPAVLWIGEEIGTSAGWTRC